MVAFNWTCPYCGQATTITEPNYSHNHNVIGTSESKYDHVCIVHHAISCPNQDCNELYLSISLKEYRSRISSGRQIWVPSDTIQKWKLLPRSREKPQPEYIPEQIRQDYREACLIVDDSPKAAATLARRCLQGIVRDFWKIPAKNRGNLGAEINYIKDRVDEDTWHAIHAIRSVGDIGAHMEKNVDVIVDVEPEEAELLIELIETLFEDWYVDKHKREQRSAHVKAIIQKKRQERKDAKLISEKVADVVATDVAHEPSDS